MQKSPATTTPVKVKQKSENDISKENENIERETLTEPDRNIPLDFAVVKRILKSMGVDEYEPRVVNQLMEFMHRYVIETLTEAREYSLYANKSIVDEDDVRLAVQSRLSHHYVSPPPRDLLLELAEKRNAILLPPIPNEYGVHLPPPEHQLTASNVIIQPAHSKTGSIMNSDRSHHIKGEKKNLSTQELKSQGSRNKTKSAQQIQINLSTQQMSQ